jgi:signal recognition particle subunit SRP19
MSAIVEDAPLSSESDAGAAPVFAKSVPDEAKKWVAVWPTYLNKNKSVAAGRKVSRQLAVADPHPKEIMMACAVLGLRCGMERKAYSRDFLDMLRVRVQLRAADGTLLVADIRNRRALLVRLARAIAALEHRVNPPPPTPQQLAALHEQARLQALHDAQVAKALAAKEKADKAAASAPSSSSSSSSSSSAAPAAASRGGKKKK